MDAAFMPMRREVNYPLRDGAAAPLTAADGSWATASLLPNSDGTHIVLQAGPRRPAAVGAWQRLDQPKIAAFGVTAGADCADQRVWLGSPSTAFSWPLPI